MRPINLIPPEDRRGEQAPLRSGPLAYILLGALVTVLVAITAMVLLDNQIGEREREIAQLEREDAIEGDKAERLVAYTQFRTLSEQRVATVSSLADSRFDWERVMRELSLVLPSDVWLVRLGASATPDATVEGGGSGSSGSNLRGSAPGPALELSGCATGQEAVAGFVTALKDIDGVTRVGVQFSELPEEEEEAASTEVGAATSENTEECQTREFIAKFEIVAVFDAAPVPITSSSETVAAAPVESTEASSEESSESAAEEK